jgi:hypothetical protein
MGVDERVGCALSFAAYEVPRSLFLLFFLKNSLE